MCEAAGYWPRFQELRNGSGADLEAQLQLAKDVPGTLFSYSFFDVV